MANTYVDYTATAAQQYFAFNFPYLEDEHVVVEIEGVDQTITTNYTIETSPTQRINLSNPTTALAGGELVRIKRRSAPNTNLVDFQNGSVLTESELDRAYLHNRYLAEEATEGADSGLKELEGSTNYNAGNKQIKNLADGTLATDAVNKGYVDTQIALTDTNLAGFFKSTHTGNAVDNVFTLSFTPQTTEAEAYIVSIDGLVQVPDTDYTIGATDITFNTIPANSAEICVVATAASSVATVNEAQVTATGSSQARSLADRFADVVNVLDYGAKGDGVTDDTTAIQAALNSGAKTIEFPRGSYLVSSSFDINDQNVSGYSRNGTIIKSTGNIQQVFRLGGDGSITNLTIDLNSQPTVGIVLTSFTDTSGDYRSGLVDSVVLKNAGYTSPVNITNIVASSGTTTVTASGHGLSNNDLVRIQNVNGLVSQVDPSRSVVDAYFHVYDVTSTTFKLAWDCESYSPVDTTYGGSTNYTAYVSGGTVTRIGAGITQRKVNEYPSGQQAPHSVNNLIFNNNYTHIITFFSLYTSFNELLLKSTTGGHSIAQVFGTYHARFKNCFINTGVWINTGCRDGVFDSCRFQTETNWLDPVIDAVGHNAGDGSEGGEVANYTITACTFQHNSTSFVGPYILTNGHSWSFKNCVTRIKSTSTWTWANFYSTLYLELTQLTFESRNASVWYLTDPTEGTGVHTRADGIWFTQSAGKGTCYWGRQRYGSLLSNNSFIEVKNSNMHHAIAPTGSGGERYSFEQIEGDLDLTNAVDGTVKAFAVSGTITAPEKLLEFSGEDYITKAKTPALVYGTNITYNSQVGKSIQIKDVVVISFSIDIASSSPDNSQIALEGIEPNISSTYQAVSCNIDVGASTFFNIATNGVPHGEYSGSFELKFYKSDGTALTFNDCASSGVVKGLMLFVTD